VGIFPKGASQCGALDMSGNVWEWCLTKWRENYKTPADDNPEGNAERVVRGGSYRDVDMRVRCAVRNWNYPHLRSGGIGLRVVALSPAIMPLDSGDSGLSTTLFSGTA
jgi:formylglycine-generating enzyme required for sulfatase activity